MRIFFSFILFMQLQSFSAQSAVCTLTTEPMAPQDEQISLLDHARALISLSGSYPFPENFIEKITVYAISTNLELVAIFDGNAAHLPTQALAQRALHRLDEEFAATAQSFANPLMTSAAKARLSNQLAQVAKGNLFALLLTKYPFADALGSGFSKFDPAFLRFFLFRLVLRSSEFLNHPESFSAAESFRLVKIHSLLQTEFAKRAFANLKPNLLAKAATVLKSWMNKVLDEPSTPLLPITFALEAALMNYYNPSDLNGVFQAAESGQVPQAFSTLPDFVKARIIADWL